MASIVPSRCPSDGKAGEKGMARKRTTATKTGCGRGRPTRAGKAIIHRAERRDGRRLVLNCKRDDITVDEVKLALTAIGLDADGFGITIERGER